MRSSGSRPSSLPSTDPIQVAAEPHPLRVLQLIGDTDPSATNLAAVALHRELADVDVEVRTLALAPGRRGGLDDAVPVMAPTRRSWTIRRVLDRESRWADVTLVHAPGALVRRTRRRAGRPPVVVVLPTDHDEPDSDPLPGEGVDLLVVVAPVGSGTDTGGPGVVRLTEPIDAATWRELLASCVTRSR